MIDTKTKMNTPAFSKLIIDNEVEARLKYDEEHLGDNWENKETNACPRCKGTGKNPEFPEDPFCFGCEGTGIHFILTYGMSGGKAYAYTEEYGIDFIKEYCKERREAWAATQLAGKTPEKMLPYALPKTLEIELISRGYNPEELYSGSYVREIANVVSREYPDFLCVPYTNF